MPTNEERRQVAARLRSVNGAPEWATTACCIAECLGEHDYPLWNDSEKLFNRLADLIEPEPERTCRIDMDYEYEAYDLPSYWRWYACSECDERFAYYKCDSVSFCPNCGARVKEEADATE